MSSCPPSASCHGAEALLQLVLPKEGRKAGAGPACKVLRIPGCSLSSFSTPCPAPGNSLDNNPVTGALNLRDICKAKASERSNSREVPLEDRLSSRHRVGWAESGCGDGIFPFQPL